MTATANDDDDDDGDDSTIQLVTRKDDFRRNDYDFPIMNFVHSRNTQRAPIRRSEIQSLSCG